MGPSMRTHNFTIDYIQDLHVHQRAINYQNSLFNVSKIILQLKYNNELINELLKDVSKILVWSLSRWRLDKLGVKHLVTVILDDQHSMSWNDWNWKCINKYWAYECNIWVFSERLESPKNNPWWGRWWTLLSDPILAWKNYPVILCVA